MNRNERPQYITQINAFHSFMRTHYLPLNARMLWFSLIDLCNSSGWAQWVYVDTLHLMAMIDAKSDKTAFLARKKLVDAGLLVYEKGKKSQPCRYRLVWFSGNNSVENSVESSGENDGGSYRNTQEETAERHTLYSRKDKEKSREENKGVPAELCEVWRAFAEMRRKMRKPLTPSAEKLLLQTLRALSGEVGIQKQILEQSILNGWAGVYPLKTEQAPQPPASYDIEEMERRLLYGKIEYKKRPEKDQFSADALRM